MPKKQFKEPDNLSTLEFIRFLMFVLLSPERLDGPVWPESIPRDTNGKLEEINAKYSNINLHEIRLAGNLALTFVDKILLNYFLFGVLEYLQFSKEKDIISIFYALFLRLVTFLPLTFLFLNDVYGTKKEFENQEYLRIHYAAEWQNNTKHLQKSGKFSLSHANFSAFFTAMFKVYLRKTEKAPSWPMSFSRGAYKKLSKVNVEHKLAINKHKKIAFDVLFKFLAYVFIPLFLIFFTYNTQYNILNLKWEVKLTGLVADFITIAKVIINAMAEYKINTNEERYLTQQWYEKLAKAQAPHPPTSSNVLSPAPEKITSPKN